MWRPWLSRPEAPTQAVGRDHRTWSARRRAGGRLEERSCYSGGATPWPRQGPRSPAGTGVVVAKMGRAPVASIRHQRNGLEPPRGRILRWGQASGRMMPLCLLCPATLRGSLGRPLSPEGRKQACSFSSTMTNAEQLEEHLFTELKFRPRHLSPLRRLYRQMCRGLLGSEFAFRESPGLHANMKWHYASNARTLQAFQHCLAMSHLRESLSIIQGNSELLAACFVVVKGETPLTDFHVDYGQSEIPAGATGTMLTPLLPFDERFGHLDCREGALDFEYRYQMGDAIPFDGKFEHRSQVSGTGGAATRILVSWSIATSDIRYRHAIRRVIDSQTK